MEIFEYAFSHVYIHFYQIKFKGAHMRNKTFPSSVGPMYKPVDDLYEMCNAT